MSVVKCLWKNSNDSLELSLLAPEQLDLIMAFLLQQRHLNWLYGWWQQFQPRDLIPIDVTPPSEHPVLSGTTGFTWSSASPHFSFSERINASSAPGFLDFFIFLVVLSSPCHFSIKIKKIEQSFFCWHFQLRIWGESHTCLIEMTKKMRSKARCVFCLVGDK